MGEHDTFIFPHYGNYLCVIDFSRCLYGDRALEDVKKEKGVLAAEQLMGSQLDAIVKLLKLYISPERVDKDLPKIKAMSKTDPNILFRLVSGTDFISTSRAIFEMLKIEMKHLGEQLTSLERRHCQINADSIKFVEKLYLLD